MTDKLSYITLFITMLSEIKWFYYVAGENVFIKFVTAVVNHSITQLLASNKVEAVNYYANLSLFYSSQFSPGLCLEIQVCQPL